MKQVSLRVVTGLILVAIILTITVAYFAWAATPTTDIWVSPGIYPGAPSYTIWREGSNYYSKDQNGYIAYSGTNATQVIQNSITVGTSLFLKAAIYMEVGLLTLKNNFVLWGEGNNTVLSGRDTDAIFNHTTDLSHVTIRDICLKGNSLTNWGIKGRYKNSLFQNLYFTNFVNGSIWALTPSDLTGWLANRFIGLRCSGGGQANDYMLRIATTDSIIDSCIISQYEGTAIGALGSSMRIIHNHIWQIGEFGIVVGATFVHITENWLEGCNISAIYISGDNAYTRKAVIANNLIWYNDLDGDGVGAGIRLYGDVANVTDVLIESNWLGNLQNGGGLQPYGVVGTGWLNNVTITSNHFYNHTNRHIFFNTTFGSGQATNILVANNFFGKLTIGANSAILLDGTFIATYIIDNLGYTTENWGNNSGTTGFTVNHGLDATPTYIFLTPQGNVGNFTVSAIGTTTFTINFDGGGTKAFFWYAKYEP